MYTIQINIFNMNFLVSHKKYDNINLEIQCDIFIDEFRVFCTVEKLVKCYIWSIGFYGVETWTLGKVDQNHLERYDVWWWRRSVGPVVWEIKKYYTESKWNVLHTIKRTQAKWIGYVLHRNCLIKHIIEGNIKEGIEVTGRQEERLTKLLDDFKEIRGYWKLK